MIKEYWLKDNPIPNGYRIFEESILVMGTPFRKRETEKFIRSRSNKISLQREPNNEFDQNAIKVLGRVKSFLGTKDIHFGYIPKEISAKLAEKIMFNDVVPRLYHTYLSDDGFVEVTLQLIGPKKLFERYVDIIAEEEVTHFTDRVASIKMLKRQNKNNEALRLLMLCIEETEKDSAENGYGVAPWYYEQAAIIYRKEKRFEDEIKILERYNAQTKAPGSGPEKLKLRLEKAKAKNLNRS